jgi:phage baseplate assembly protein W
MITVMDRQTGKQISGLRALDQSVSDILSTEAGTEVLLRSYGVDLLDMVDSDYSSTQIAFEITRAIRKWLGKYMDVIRVRSVGERGAVKNVEILYRYGAEVYMMRRKVRRGN